MALERGELTPQEFSLVMALADKSSHELEPVWHSQATMARLVYGPDRYPTEGAGRRTAGSWIHDLKRKGWVAVQQRVRRVEGRLRGETNLTWLTIPDEYHSVVEGHQDRARSRSAKANGKGRPTPRAPQNRERPPDPQPSVRYERAEQLRQAQLAADAAAGPTDPEVARKALEEARRNLRPGMPPRAPAQERSPP